VSDTLKCPWPYYGGKSRVAARAWAAIGGDCHGYVEPFAGSLAGAAEIPGGR